MRLVLGNLTADSAEALASTFHPFHTVVGCMGFVGGAGIQRRLARAVLDAGVARCVPWQFGVDWNLNQTFNAKRENHAHHSVGACPEHFRIFKPCLLGLYAPPTPRPAISRGLTALSYSASSTPFLSAASLSVLPESSAWWAILLALS